MNKINLKLNNNKSRFNIKTINTKWIAIISLIVLVVIIGSVKLLLDSNAQSGGASGSQNMGSNYMVYVASSVSNKISAYNSSGGSDVLSKAINIPNNPRAAVGTPDGKYIYSIGGSSYDGVINVIQVSDNTVFKTITNNQSGSGSYTNIKISPDGQYVYAVGRGRQVSVIKASDNTIVKNLDINQATDVAITPDSQFAWIVSRGNPEVTIIKTSDFSTVSTFNLSKIRTPHGVAISPNGSYAVVSDRDQDNTDIINTSAPYNVTRSIDTDHENNGKVLISNDSRYVYIGEYYRNDNNGYIRVWDNVANRFVTTIRAGDYEPIDMAMTADGKYIYIVSSRNNRVYVIDTSTNRVLRNFSVPNGASGIAITVPHIDPPITKSSIVMRRNADGTFTAKDPSDRTAQPGDEIQYTIKYKVPGAPSVPVIPVSECMPNGLGGKGTWSSDIINVTYTFCNNGSSSVSPTVTGNISYESYTDSNDCRGNLKNKPTLSQGTYTSQNIHPSIQCRIDPRANNMLITWNVGSIPSGGKATFSMKIATFNGAIRPDSWKMLDSWKSTNPSTSTPDLTMGDLR